MSGGFKLGKMTLHSLFSKPATELYPTVKHEYFPMTRGMVMIDIDRCIQCGTCARGCPTECLSVDKANHTWSINHFQCVQCQHCVRSCPVHCLTMDPHYTPSATEKHIDVYMPSAARLAELKAQEKERAEKQARARAAAEAKKKAKAAEEAKKDQDAASAKDSAEAAGNTDSDGGTPANEQKPADEK